ncbi:Inner membrane protein YqiK [Escherichia coli]|uniref:SPFH domain-containing protein n=1 Tax=Escherichia coli TaxID=562 RepID=UPI000F1BBFA2|nr:Inner membrane protein YqiK [Escherichia coli]
MFTAIISVCILFIIGIIFAGLYRRASAEQAFVRTGLGGQKVVMSGGAIVMPIFHEIIPINMNTLKLEVSRSTIDSLITKDRMRVDVVVAFFVRVKPSVEGIATARRWGNAPCRLKTYVCWLKINLSSLRNSCTNDHA